MSDMTSKLIRNDVAVKRSATSPVPEEVAIDTAAPRKLVRPPMDRQKWRDKTTLTSSLLTHSQMADPTRGGSPGSTQAEVFYFQKQVQAQTQMVVVLEDGEELGGVIEWFDTNVLKLRLGDRQRVLVYKSAVKYIYKAGENAPPIMR
jgi:sRNA-binding regulator protein Hfq